MATGMRLSSPAGTDPAVGIPKAWDAERPFHT
jgi:hypothetical protein